MENIVFIIVMEGCAVLFLYLGFLLWKKQQIQLTCNHLKMTTV